MPLLFSYGTLQLESVQLALFRRTLAATKDALLGYERAVCRVQDADFARTSGTAEHAILRPARDAAARVEGTVFEVTDAELAQADRYEPVEYKRVLGALESGRQAWVYVEAARRES